MKKQALVVWAGLALAASSAAEGQASPRVLIPGYALTRVSDGVPSSHLAQLAFNPIDAAHLYAVQAEGQVLRYDYDPATGGLCLFLQLFQRVQDLFGVSACELHLRLRDTPHLV